MRITKIFLLMVSAILVLSACQPIMAPTPAASSPTATPAAAAAKDIVDTAVAAGNFKTLVAAVEAAGLVDTLKGEGPFTVFAPTDDAFKALPAGTVDTLLKDPKGDLTQILLYHVLPGKVMAADVKDGLEAKTVQGSPVTFKIDGQNVMINQAKIVTTDIVASNGVIHVIDAVIMPPAKSAEAAPAEAKAADIVDTAVAAGKFKTLVAAVEAAGLVETLKGKGPFTVFAPTDEAFAALPAGTVDALLKDPKGDLTKILLYHVVEGKVMAADVAKMDGQMVKTVGGGELTIKVDSGKVAINSSNVITADIETSNGVIHVIDAVLLPK